MVRLATFADLPYEVAEYILVSAARTWAGRDSASLARLARTTRPIHTVVQPILTSCVVVTASNVWSVFAIASDTPDAFASTRRMVVDIEPDDSYRFIPGLLTLSRSLKYFTHLVAFAGAAVHCTIVSGLCASTLKVLAVTCSHGRAISLPAGVTHMRVCTDLKNALPEIVSERVQPVRLMIDIELGSEDYFGFRLLEEVSKYELPEYERVTFVFQRLHASRTKKILRHFAKMTRNLKLFVAVDDSWTIGISILDERRWSIGKQLYVPDGSST